MTIPTYARRITDSLRRRVPQDGVILIKMDEPDPIMLRPRARDSLAAGGARTLIERFLSRQESHAEILGAMHPFCRLSRTIQGIVPRDGSPQLAGMGLLAGLAMHWAARLADQMGTSLSFHMDTRRDFRGMGDELLKKETQVQEHERKVTRSLMAALRTPPSGKSPVVWLELENRDDTLRAKWLDEDRKVLSKGLLYDRLLKTLDDATLDTMQNLDAYRKAYVNLLDKAQEALPSLSPTIADDVADARRRKVRVVRPLFQTVYKGFRSQALLYVDARQPESPQVNLVVRRAHEEFVLEADNREMFYFPPVQLAAIIHFRLPAARGRLCDALVPQVRIPKGGSDWVHPYTGSMSEDPFADAEWLGEREDEPMLTASPDAQERFPRLAKTQHTTRASDLCLDGQTGRITEMNGRVQDALKAHGTPDSLGVVDELWSIARMGLTRGHQNNQSRPRAEMSVANMPYHIPAGASLDGSPIAWRLFRYNLKR